MKYSSLYDKNLWHITVPTLFTLSRILITPGIVFCMKQQQWGYAFYLFLIAAVTDVIDGALARWCNAHSFLGGCLDALADKFLLISCFITLACIQTPHLSIPSWFVMIALAKECILIIGSCTVFFLTGSVEIKPTALGKLTTFAQICFIIWFFFCYFFHWLPLKTYNFILWILLAFICSSLIHYCYIGAHFVIEKTRR